MKKLLLALTALALVVSASAQVPTYAPQTLSVPATIPAATSSNLASAPIIDVRKQQNVTIGFVFNMSASTTTNIDVILTPSVDGTYFDTVNTRQYSFAANGTTQVVGTTNIPCSGIGYWKVKTIYNRDASATLTNAVFNYGVKISSP